MSHRARAREAFDVGLARRRNNSFPPGGGYTTSRGGDFFRGRRRLHTTIYFPVQSCRVVVRAFILDEIVTTSGRGRRLRNTAERLARRLSFAVYVVYYSCRRQFFNEDEERRRRAFRRRIPTRRSRRRGRRSPSRRRLPAPRAGCRRAASGCNIHIEVKSAEVNERQRSTTRPRVLRFSTAR